MKPNFILTFSLLLIGLLSLVPFVNAQTTNMPVLIVPTDGKLLYVINSETNEFLCNLTMPENVYGSIVNPSGSYIYVSGASYTIYEIRTSDYTITRTLVLPSGFNPGMYILGNNMYVTGGNDDVYVIDLNSFTLIDTWGDSGSTSIGYNAQDNWIVVSTQNNKIKAYNLNGDLTKSIDLSGSCNGIIVNHRELVGIFNSLNSVELYDLESGNLIDSKWVASPSGISKSVTTDNVYFVVNSYGTQITKLSTSTNSISYSTPRNITGLYYPYSISNSVDGQSIYVGGGTPNNYSVTVINPTGPTSYSVNKLVTIYGYPWYMSTGYVLKQVSVTSQLVKITVAGPFGIITYSGVPITVKDAMGNIINTQLTGNDGCAPFILSPNTLYTITAKDESRNINRTITLYPTNTAYTIDVGISPIINFNRMLYSNTINNTYVFNNGTGDPLQDITLTINQSSREIPTSRSITATYNDDTASTNTINFSLYKMAGNVPGYVSSQVVTNDSNTTVVFNIVNESQNKLSSTYKVVVIADTNAYGDVERVKYASWDGTGYLLPGLGLDNKALPYKWICFGVIFLIIIIGTFMSNGVIIFIAGAAWEIMIAIGWMASSTQNLALGALVMAIGVGYVLMQKRREVV